MKSLNKNPFQERKKNHPATGWLPPKPDLRDYGEKNDMIRVILNSPLLSLSPSPTRKGKTKNPRGEATEGKIDLREWCSPVEDQGSIGSCTAHAAAGIVEYYERRAFKKHLEASRLFLYKTTRNLMQSTGDSGAWLRCTMGALVMCGLPDEKYWPYDEDSFDEEPPAFVYSVANNYQTMKYFRHDLEGGGRRTGQEAGEGAGLRAQGSGQKEDTLASVKKYLEAGILAMFGFWGFDSYDKSDTKGGIPYPAENESAQWGHAVAAFGYDDKKKIKNTVNNKSSTGALLIRNSWGKEWGDEGYGWLPYEYVLNGLAEDFWSVLAMEWVDTGEFGV